MGEFLDFLLRIVDFHFHGGLLLHARQDIGLLAHLLRQQGGQVVVTATMVIAILVWHVASLADDLSCVLRLHRLFCGGNGEFDGGLFYVPALCVHVVLTVGNDDAFDGGHVAHAGTSLVVEF